MPSKICRKQRPKAVCSMFSRCRSVVVPALLSGILVLCARGNEARVLRIAADPNNLPFSNNRGEGFENKIAELLARELGVRIEWVWHAQRRGFFRETLKENNADLVLGLPAHFDLALTTTPYYRSTYVFVRRADQQVDIGSLDDPRLRTMK